ncbi:MULTISPECIES: TDP-N-acetylfucosamine:lipid II N-acetylfucosaminyltransferase [unclassified Lentimonas]|uniref:TDP-N-acetylfucosamine:lipid II N-acetylfucosaminyltransferase n=1 Tax=unclassified Lentimonas TaxID=2630993 RepID=UPI001325ADDC|nr:MULTISPECIES: TDP-N-acetylfucosamine:lipid II N-acetylfucosaminyltransferase [unclassified Lentimonas]CAA6680038.1 Unannotated [Lentimonas sp. CC4]CAA6685158.1 Unannotated [Lentimonas sp. CC6]CAA7075116.1 Unannotated [Lentimonas sp. CC4]CAA7168424.1 Unannotated [Lentimonas sp. CC21]CAA7182141.1 Unannotated [Lentimonas sp. CC8]
MFLHLIFNESKFPQRIKMRFERVSPNQHCYVVLRHPGTKSVAGDDFQSVCNPEELAVIVGARNDWEGVILNGMLAHLAAYLGVLPPDVKCAYYLWGFEAYGLLQSSPTYLLLPRTAQLTLTLKARLRWLVYGLLGRRRRLRICAKAVATRIDVALFPIHEELEMLKQKRLIHANTKCITGMVGMGMDQAIEIGKRGSLGESILLGNSSAVTNNHIDLFYDIYENVKLEEGQQIIVPLNYGSTKEYRDAVIQAGHELFGDQFVPITEFMALDDYHELLMQCGHVFMNHCRQQALGNTLMTLSMGATVYLRPESTVSIALKRLGFHFCDIKGIVGAGSKKRRLLSISDDCALENKELVQRHFSVELSLQRTVELLDFMRQS